MSCAYTPKECKKKNIYFLLFFIAQQQKDDNAKAADTAKTIPASNNQNIFGGALKGK